MALMINSPAAAEDQAIVPLAGDLIDMGSKEVAGPVMISLKGAPAKITYRSLAIKEEKRTDYPGAILKVGSHIFCLHFPKLENLPQEYLCRFMIYNKGTVSGVESPTVPAPSKKGK